MMVNLVIEGANGSGKSTLIDKICDELKRMGYPFKLTDLTKPKSNQEIDEMAEEFMSNTGINIYDRVFWFSDFIYPVIYGTPKNQYIEDHLFDFWAINQKVIFCADQFDIDESEHHKRTAEELENIKLNRCKLVMRYEHTMACYSNFVSFDRYMRYTSDIDISEVINFILSEV